MKCKFFSSALLVFSAMSAQMNAQVGIGTETIEPFSLLKLENNGKEMGFRLPQMTTQQRDNMQATADFQAEKTGAAMGLQIFNTQTKCIETWNGTVWIQQCPPTGPAVPPITPYAPVSCNISASSDNKTFVCIADPAAEAYGWFVDGVAQGETTTNSITFATAQTGQVSVSYYFPPAYLKPTMLPVAGNGGNGTWYYGDTPPGNATTVSIPDLLWGETPITQAQFSAVMGGVTPYTFNCYGNWPSTVSCRPTSALPAETINWYMAIAYCNKLSLLEGKTPAYSVAGVSDWAALQASSIPTADNDPIWSNATCDFSADGYRLPTESEWEYTARGGTANVHQVFSGSDYTGDPTTQNANDALDLVGWYRNNDGNENLPCDITFPYGTKPVKEKSPNVFGLYDMNGNVNEMCWSLYYDAFPMATPTTVVSTNSNLHIMRGGDWNSSSSDNRVSARAILMGQGNNGSGNFYIGFRVVRKP